LTVTLFHYGEFEMADARMAAMALMAYCAGLPAFIGVKILAPAYFSRQDTRTPVRIAIIALVANMALNIVFLLTLIAYLAGGDFSRGLFATLAAHPGAHVALALASSSSAWINAALLWRHLDKTSLRPGIPWLDLARVLPACAVMVLMVYWFMPEPALLAAESPAGRAFNLLRLVLLGAVAYGATLLASGMRPAKLARPTE
jgi:putative peptidoglycan lipid II flippase